MNIGDLVCWKDKPSLLGVVVKVSDTYRHTIVGMNQWTACKVQGANGGASTHSSRQMIKLETSENT